MQLRYLALAAFAGVAALWVACDETPSGCEDAKNATETLIQEICQEPAYAGTPFCSCCVANQFFSVSNDCTCRGLEFNTDACYFAIGDQAKPQTRDAVEFANSICKGRLVGVPSLEAATQQCKAAGESGSGGAFATASAASSSGSSSTTSSSSSSGP
jgi:hypothetical protein